MKNDNCRTAICREAGFTLIEVMITVAIIAILSAVALPSYRDYVIRGNIPDGTSRLATKQVQMEQLFQDDRRYDTRGTTTGAGCATDSASGKFFDFTCSTAPGGLTANAFTIVAVGKGSMSGFAFTINQTGAKTTDAVPTGWSQPSPNNCWVIRKGGAC